MDIRASYLFKYKPELYDKLKSSAYKQTRIGRFANFFINLFFYLLEYYRTIRMIFKRRNNRSNKTSSNKWLWDDRISIENGFNIKNGLIIAETSIPQCYKYRVQQKIEMFEELGWGAKVLDWHDYFLCRSAIQISNIVIFYRVPYVESVQKIITECKRLQCVTFFDVDDLIFDVDEYQKNPNLKLLDNKQQNELINGAKLYQETLSVCDNAIASTKVIADYMSRYNYGKIFIIENCIDRELLSLLSIKEKGIIPEDYSKVIIGYGSGTSTHNVDFKECEKALINIFDKYPNVILAIHGSLDLSEEFLKYQDRILKIPFLKSTEYYMSISSFDINLAPLSESVFNDAKSNIKFLEASIFAIPTVASPRTEYKKIIKNGINGFLCNDENEWYTTLSLLIENISLRKITGQQAKNDVLTLCNYKNIAQTQMSLMTGQFLKKNNRKRLLMVNVLYKPITFGGATIVVENLVKNIHNAGEYEVTVFTGFMDDRGDDILSESLIRYEMDGVNIIALRLPAGLSTELEYRNENIKKMFDEILTAFLPDIVHFHSIQLLGASMAISCTENKIPYIITLHDAWWICEKQFFINRDGESCQLCESAVDPRYCAVLCTNDATITYARFFYLKNILKSSALLLAPSNYWRNVYIRNGIDENLIKVNKNGISYPSKGYKKNENLKVTFAYLGGNARHKGYDWLKSIFEKIQIDNYILVISDIQRKLGSPSLDRNDWKIKGELSIVDGYDYDNIDQFFSEIDVLLVPSQCNESFGLTVREALVRGVWVIATDSGGLVEDIVDGVNGRIVLKSDKEGFMAAIEDVILNGTNPGFRIDNIRSFKEQAAELLDYYADKLSK